MRLSFDVGGDPKPEPRPRSAGGRRGVYVPRSAHEWKRAVRSACAIALMFSNPVTDRAGPFRLEMAFRFSRPKSHYRTGRHSGSLRPAKRSAAHLTTPDVDNLAKAVADALGAWEGEALVYRDDSQVIEWALSKRYVEPGETPGCAVVIEEL